MRFFLVRTKADNGLQRHAKKPSSLLHQIYGNRKESDEEAKECFLQDTEIQQKWLQKDHVKEQALEIA